MCKLCVFYIKALCLNVMTLFTYQSSYAKRTLYLCMSGALRMHKNSSYFAYIYT